MVSFDLGSLTEIRYGCLDLSKVAGSLFDVIYTPRDTFYEVVNGIFMTFYQVTHFFVLDFVDLNAKLELVTITTDSYTGLNSA